MTYSGVERRRVPRVSPNQSYEVLLATTVPVQVIDISPTGLQLTSKFPLAVGDHGELRTSIGTQSVRVNVEIRRVAMENGALRGGARYRAGAVFGTMTVDQQILLKQGFGPEPS